MTRLDLLVALERAALAWAEADQLYSEAFLKHYDAATYSPEGPLHHETADALDKMHRLRPAFDGAGRALWAFDNAPRSER